jgi:hypothetical protein
VESSRPTRLLVTALEECLCHAIERDRLATDLVERDVDVQRLREQVKRLQQRVDELAALAAAPPDEAEGDAPSGLRLVYQRELRTATITRPDGLSITLEVYPPSGPRSGRDVACSFSTTVYNRGQGSRGPDGSPGNAKTLDFQGLSRREVLRVSCSAN